jgi:hypothetical protein
MTFKRICAILLVSASVFTACNNEPSPVEKEPGSATAPVTSVNYLRMKVNGKDWVADHELTGIVYPEGYNQAILIGGTKGPKDKHEQAFSLNLYNINGPGAFTFESGNKDNNVVQMGNLSEEHYLYGNVLGFRMRVTITKATKNPVELEASFEGELTGNAGDTLKITAGKFYYHD